MLRRALFSLPVAVVLLALTILSLPGLPSDVAGWGKWLAFVDTETARWALPICGWVGLVLVAVYIWSSRQKPGRDEVTTTSRRKRASAPWPQLRKAVECELVVIIDEAKAFAPDALRKPRYGPYELWRSKTADFIATVLGAIERQRFTDPPPPPNVLEFETAVESALKHRLNWLRDLRDRPETWNVQVDAEGLQAAINQRRALSDQERIILAG